MSQPVAPEEVEARRRERAEEYGAFIAAQPIPWMGAPAFTTGDPVPKSTVERLGWVELGLVVKAGTKAAEALQPALTDPTEAMDAAARAFGGPEAAGPPPEPKKTAAARKKPPADAGDGDDTAPGGDNTGGS